MQKQKAIENINVLVEKGIIMRNDKARYVEELEILIPAKRDKNERKSLAELYSEIGIR